MNHHRAQRELRFLMFVYQTELKGREEVEPREFPSQYKMFAMLKFYWIFLESHDPIKLKLLAQIRFDVLWRKTCACDFYFFGKLEDSRQTSDSRLLLETTDNFTRNVTLFSIQHYCHQLLQNLPIIFLYSVDITKPLNHKTVTHTN